MKPKPQWSIFANALAVAATVLSIASTASAAPKYKVLHAFGAGNDGATVWGGLVRDSKGHLYGTTAGGGAYTYGSVFELTPDSGGKWTEQVLHSFQNNGSDGTEPSSTLILDGVGNLYGTTPDGANRHCTYGCGVVFELTPHPSGWSEAVLYRFPLPRGGCCPYAGVIRDAEGNLYGTAGYPFELSPGSHGWEEKVLSRFPGTDNGSEPFAGLVMDPSGSLYGTTQHGGGSPNCGDGCGTVFQVTPEPDGKWKERILHRFGSSGDGAFPGVGSLVLDKLGNVYGTTDIGGPSRYGTVFKLTPQTNGGWKEAILYSFTDGSDGGYASAGVVIDNTGNLYGTTFAGGDPNCGCGVVYRLAPQASGKWKYTVLHTFIGSDGAQPDANLILDDKGNLYGTTAVGGTAGAGVAFELTP
jgi:uncharacterized repeat protein (TIGR03803 family)